MGQNNFFLFFFNHLSPSKAAEPLTRRALLSMKEHEKNIKE